MKEYPKFEFSIIVFDDHAIIEGKLSSDVLVMLIKFCEKQGFTHMTNTESGIGFKLVRNEDG